MVFAFHGKSDFDKVEQLSNNHLFRITSCFTEAPQTLAPLPTHAHTPTISGSEQWKEDIGAYYNQHVPLLSNQGFMFSFTGYNSRVPLVCTTGASS